MEASDCNKKISINEGILYKYAQLIVNIPNLGVKTFSYTIPEEFKEIIKIGQAVLVSFGNKGVVNAFIVGFSNYMPEGIKAKPLLEIIEEKPLFSLEYLNFLHEVGNYYCCPLQKMLELAIPMKFLKQSQNIVSLIKNEENEKLNESAKKIVNLLKNGETALNTLQKKSKLPSAKFYAEMRKLKKALIVRVETTFQESSQKEQSVKFIKLISTQTENKRYKTILSQLENSEERELIEFEKEAKTTRKTIQNLAKEGLVEVYEKNVFRNPLDIYQVLKTEDFYSLTNAQQKVYDFIKTKIEGGTDKPILLHGVTAAGKTEIYFHLIRDTLNKGQNVLFLVPEIALASELTRRLAKRFGTEKVAIWHSSISDGEKFDIWQKLRKNEIKILAGVRSAVFAPLQNIGLIVIDEEHESTFKQSSPSPRYNAKTVVAQLAKLTGATILQGSATPDVNTYYTAFNNENLVSLTERFNNAKMAKVIAVDMRQEKINGNNMLFSRTLINAINDGIKNSLQTILLINRRGYATSTQCEACGKTFLCPKCDIPLVLHNEQNKLRCHYCDWEMTIPKTCPDCHSEAIYSTGIGIEKVEKITRRIFPEAVIARIDSDIAAKKNACATILEDFRNGKINILIGTQMIAKGLDNPNVSVVGVINADSSFNFPDFRCSERGFQLLTQVAGRAGRGDIEGKVYFQTFNPESFVLDNAKNQDYLTFYKEEIEARETFDYPPFSQIIMLFLTSQQEWRAKGAAQQIAEQLRNVTVKKQITEYINILGPSPCIFEKIRGEYRFQIMIKNKLGQKGHALLTRLFGGIILPEDIKLTIDVDPLDIM